jgi:hypothetical protein
MKTERRRSANLPRMPTALMCKLRQRGRGYGGPGPAGARGIDPSLQPPPAVAASPLRKDPLPHTCPKERNFRLPPEARWDATSPCQVRGLYRTRRQAGLRAATSGSLSARTAPCIQYAPINRAAILEAVPHVAPHEQHGPCEAKGPTEHQWAPRGPQMDHGLTESVAPTSRREAVLRVVAVESREHSCITAAYTKGPRTRPLG